MIKLKQMNDQREKGSGAMNVISTLSETFVSNICGGRRGLNTGFSEFLSLIPGFSGEFFVIRGLPEVFSIITGSECFLIDFATKLCNIVSS